MVAINKNFLNKLPLVLSLALSLHQTSQAVEEDFRLWQTVIMEGNFTADIRWYAEIQGRWRDDVKQFDQAILRPAINYGLSDKSTLWFGYSYVDTQTVNGHTSEDRWWQQFQYVSNFNDVTWLSRTRLEQRNLDGADRASNRIRQQLRASWPMNNLNDLNYLVWNELFWNINTTEWAGESGFNQNRLFTGIMWKCTNQSRLEIGYLNQYVNGSYDKSDQANHTISSTLFIGF